MFRNIKDFLGYSIRAQDGNIGHIEDFYFDDDYWIIRYVVVVCGNWLTGREVLISPEAITKSPNGIGRYLSVNLTKSQVEKSPDINIHKPVSRQGVSFFMDNNMYGRPSLGVFGYGWTGIPMVTKADNTKRDYEPHLRSTKEVKTYSINATNGIIGHVEDFIVDDETWKLCYMVVNTQKWLPGGRHVLIAISCIDKIIWVDSQVSVNLTKEQIKNSPHANALRDLGQVTVNGRLN